MWCPVLPPPPRTSWPGRRWVGPSGPGQAYPGAVAGRAGGGRRPLAGVRPSWDRAADGWAHGHRILGKTEMALQHRANGQQFTS